VRFAGAKLVCDCEPIGPTTAKSLRAIVTDKFGGEKNYRRSDERAPEMKLGAYEETRMCQSRW